MNFPFRFHHLRGKSCRIYRNFKTISIKTSKQFSAPIHSGRKQKTKPSFQLFSFPIIVARPRRLLREASKFLLCVLIANFFGFLCKVLSIRKFNFLFFNANLADQLFIEFSINFATISLAGWLLLECVCAEIIALIKVD